MKHLLIWKLKDYIRFSLVGFFRRIKSVLMTDGERTTSTQVAKAMEHLVQ